MELLKKEIESQLNELMENGSIAECRKLNAAMPAKEDKYLLDDMAIPMHFSGDLKSKIVFVELNPGGGNLRPERGANGLVMEAFGLDPAPVISDVNSYFEFFENLGHYKVESHKKKKQAISRFDNKQLNFFSGFNKRPIENKKKYTFDDVVKIRKEKLQLEIVPYMSSRFTFKNFSNDYIDKQIEKIQRIINTHEREYVFVTGSDVTLARHFGVNIESYRILNKKSNVYIGVKLIDGIKYCFIKTYKAQGFDGVLMQEYGRLCRKLLDMCEVIQSQH